MKTQKKKSVLAALANTLFHRVWGHVCPVVGTALPVTRTLRRYPLNDAVTINFSTRNLIHAVSVYRLLDISNR